MKTTGEIFFSQRHLKKLSLVKIARDLRIKKEYLEALEAGDWQNLPEPPFVRGFIKSYAQYLGLDANHTLAIFRREFDERKYPRKSAYERQKRLMFTPNKFVNLVLIIAVMTFIIYLAIGYTSLLSSPKLEVFAPPNDLTISVPYVVVSGQVEKGATVAIEGQIVPVDENGNFSYQLALVEGQNIIEIIASKRLSPKSKITKVVRLSR